MRFVRTAAVVTILMALPNALAGPTASSSDMPRWLAWAGTVVGIAGFVAAIALIRRADWGRQAVIAVGALNVAGGIFRLAGGHGDGVVGLVLGGIAAALCLLPAREASAATTAVHHA
jgi:hypothetical protein